MGGSLDFSAPVFGAIGQYSANNWPAGTYGGNLVYSGNDVLTYYGGVRATNLTSTVALSQVWSYNITLEQWAFISGNQNDVEEGPTYGAFRQSSASNKVGSRFELGVSGAIAGHMVVHGGTQDNGGISYINSGGNGTPVTSTFVLPVNLCITELNPCNANADCAQVGLSTTCTCRSGYGGDGYGASGCTVAPVTSKTPTAKATSAGSVVEAFAAVWITVCLLL